MAIWVGGRWEGEIEVGVGTLYLGWVRKVVQMLISLQQPVTKGFIFELSVPGSGTGGQIHLLFLPKPSNSGRLDINFCVMR